MTIRVEFYGIVRKRAGCEFITVSAETLGDVLILLEQHLSDLARPCLCEGRLADGYLLNVNGEQFTRDLSRQLQPGDAVRLMSADAGGA